jgi:metallo-beta-lactamase family protein
MESWPIEPRDVDFLILTHAHVDHIGRVPELIQKGFSGEILCTHATKALLGPMLEDALGFTHLNAGEKSEILSRLDEISWGFEYQQSFDLKRGIRFLMGRAGHILGSCWVRLSFPDAGDIVFSGDLGPRDTPLLPAPDIPAPCERLFMESTYGDRRHDDRKMRVARLGKVLSRALADGGKVLIPAFSLGRTQELIYEMDRLFSGDTIPGLPAEQERPMAALSKIPVFIDSPLGLEVTKIYARLTAHWDREAAGLLARGDHPLSFDHLYGVERHRDHKKLRELSGPAIIIAGSGMCTGGRIMDHLKWFIGDETTDILFVGYQGRGTPGRALLTHGGKPDGYIRLDDESFPIRARIHAMTGYSAHADQKELADWALAAQPERATLVHGEPPAQVSLKTLLRRRGLAVS